MSESIFLKKLQAVQSWTEDWRQIHEIKQNRFFYGMLYSLFFAIFFAEKRQNVAFGWTAGYSPSNPSVSGISLSRSATREATRAFTFW